MGVDVDLAHDPPVASIPEDKVAKVKRYLRQVLNAKVGARKDWLAKTQWVLKSE